MSQRRLQASARKLWTITLSEPLGELNSSFQIRSPVSAPSRLQYAACTKPKKTVNVETVTTNNLSAVGTGAKISGEIDDIKIRLVSTGRQGRGGQHWWGQEGY